MAAQLDLKVEGVDVTYLAEQGIVIGDNFLSKDNFRQWFEELLNAKESKEYSDLAKALEKNVKKITSANDQEITKFSKNLDQIQELFLTFTAKTSLQGSLGGKIGLLTTFNFGDKEQETYYLAEEDSLRSRTRHKTGGKAYTNTQASLKELTDSAHKAVRMNQNLQQHLYNFYIQLQDDQDFAESDRQKLYIWAYQNMKKRYIENDGRTPMSLAKYFWGEGHIHGYASEAYGSHLLLTHPNFLVDEHGTELKKSVIDEHGGKGSSNLYTLLASTKGNTGSQLSGDIVIIDRDGRVKFNVQSKASMKSSYGIYITYQKFLSNVYTFITIYKDWDKKTELEKEQDINSLFNAFSTTAWVPLKNRVENNLKKEIKNKT